MDLEIRTGLSEKAGKHNILAVETVVPGDCTASSILCSITTAQDNIACENSDGVD